MIPVERERYYLGEGFVALYIREIGESYEGYREFNENSFLCAKDITCFTADFIESKESLGVFLVEFALFTV